MHNTEQPWTNLEEFTKNLEALCKLYSVNYMGIFTDKDQSIVVGWANMAMNSTEFVGFLKASLQLKEKLEEIHSQIPPTTLQLLSII